MSSNVEINSDAKLDSLFKSRQFAEMEVEADRLLVENYTAFLLTRRGQAKYMQVCQASAINPAL
jgi:hypothetical protein